MRAMQPPKALLRAVPAAQRAARRVWRHAQRRALGVFAPQPPQPAGAAPELLEGYDATVEALRHELDSCRAGDTATFCSYVFESGESSAALLSSLRSAARRGVRLCLGCDRSPLSAFTRWWERADTLQDALDQLAADYPDFVQPLPLLGVPNHSKFLLVSRPGAGGRQDSAIFGGINIGDRFRPWRDFAVRLRGTHITAALRAAISSGGSGADGGNETGTLSFSANAPASFCPLAFALRAPLPGHFGVADTLRSFYDDPSLVRYVVAAAYVDNAGAALLSRALDRGARVTLIMPRVPNVYPHANAATLKALLHHPGAFSALLHPKMVHAKAATGFRRDGNAVAVIGSANLKCRSLTQFGELLMRCDGGDFAQSLAAALTRLAAESDVVRHEPVHAADPTAEWLSRSLARVLRPGTAELLLDEGGASALRYVPVVAALEEWMG